MFELFIAMVKEEWRMHSTMFGSLSFAMFPVMIFGIAFMGAFLLPLVRTTLPAGNLTLIVHANSLLLGFMVGAFGLLGNEVMNRRFGQASLLAYSARSLPLSESHIFTTFVIKDVVYYFFLWVFPFWFGYILASPFIGVPLSAALLLLLTLTLAFLYGLCTVFFLSAIYARSRALLWAVILVLGVAWGSLVAATGMNPALFFPPLLLYAAFSWTNLILSLFILSVLFILAIFFFSPDQTGSAKEHRNAFSPLLRRFGFLADPPLAAKDMIDLYRSGSVIGQTLFSFLIPLAVIWIFMSLLPLPSPARAPLHVRDHHRGYRLDHVYLGHDVRLVRAVRLPPGCRQPAHQREDDNLYPPAGCSGGLHCFGRPHEWGGSQRYPRSCPLPHGLLLRGRSDGLADRPLTECHGL